MIIPTILTENVIASVLSGHTQGHTQYCQEALPLCPTRWLWLSYLLSTQIEYMQYFDVISIEK